MSRLVGIAVALLVVLNSVVFSDLCNHDPFPPFPPSPPEFQTPVAVQQNGNAAVLSWVPVSADGYSVLICESGQFVPVVHDVQANDLVISDFGRSGVQEFLVMAYVKVADNLVYNSGAVGSFNFTSNVTDQPQTPDQVQVNVAEDVSSSIKTKVSMSSQAKALSLLPKFNGSHSFYSSKYPEVKNPFHQTTLPTGEVVPALLLDKDIDDTVERLILKTKAKQLMVAKVTNPGVKPRAGAPSNVIGNVTSGSKSSVVVDDSKASVKTENTLEVTSTGSNAGSSETPKDKKESNSSNVMIIIVVVILIIFFQLFKEGK